MRKILSILLIVDILFSGITIHLASHYCGSSIIDTKVSFSGKLAGCGMEHSQKHSYGYTFSNKCCDDVNSKVALNNNYIATSISSFNQYLQLSYFIYLKIEPSLDDTFSSLTEVFSRPPGAYIPNKVDRQVICIFII